jgi:nicotinamidase-related amidase
LIIDMQVGFTTPGAPAEIPNAVGIIENINAISATP